MILNEDNGVVVISNRLQEGGVPPLEQGMVVGQLSLADVLIIGNCNNQVGEQLHLCSKTHSRLSKLRNANYKQCFFM